MNIQKLHEKIEWSRQKLATPCRNRVEAVKQFVGRNYADNGSDKRVPVNLLELAVTIYVRLLAAHAPRCLVRTEYPELRPFAADMECVLNQIPEEIGLERTLRDAVLEAMPRPMKAWPFFIPMPRPPRSPAAPSRRPRRRTCRRP